MAENDIVYSRWYGVGVAFYSASLFALYALDDPSHYIWMPILGLALLGARFHQKSKARMPRGDVVKVNRGLVALFIIVLLLMFFGSVFLRRAYDLVWVPIVAGLIVGAVLFLLARRERGLFFDRSGDGD